MFRFFSFQQIHLPNLTGVAPSGGLKSEWIYYSRTQKVEFEFIRNLCLFESAQDCKILFFFLFGITVYGLFLPRLVSRHIRSRKEKHKCTFDCVCVCLRHDWHVSGSCCSSHTPTCSDPSPLSAAVFCSPEELILLLIPAFFLPFSATSTALWFFDSEQISQLSHSFCFGIDWLIRFSFSLQKQNMHAWKNNRLKRAMSCHVICRCGKLYFSTFAPWQILYLQIKLQIHIIILDTMLNSSNVDWIWWELFFFLNVCQHWMEMNKVSVLFKVCSLKLGSCITWRSALKFLLLGLFHMSIRERVHKKRLKKWSPSK